MCVVFYVLFLCTPAGGSISCSEKGMACKAKHRKYIIRTDIMYERIPPILNSDKDKEAYSIFREAEDLADGGEVDQSIVLFRRAFKMSPELAAMMGS